MTFLPSVIRAEYRGEFRIHLTFNDLSERTVDFRPWLEGPIFEVIKDRAYFRKFFVDGGAVVWPNGADIAPETLYSAAIDRGQGGTPKRARGHGPERSRARVRVRSAKARPLH